MNILISSAAVMLASSAPVQSFDTARISEDIRVLSSDEFEGRAPATTGEKHTVDYIVSQMEKAGLQPGGTVVDGKRGWTQEVPLLRSQITKAPRVTIGDKSVVQGQDIAIRAPLNGTTEVKLSDAPLVFVGYGVTAPERGWDDFKGIDLHGKIAVVLINDPDFETGQGAFGGKAMTYYGRWIYKFEEAAKRGAAGLLIVHESAPATYGWATVANSNLAPQFDIVRDSPARAHSQLEAWITREEAVRLFAASGLDFDQEKRKARERSFTPVPLKPKLSAELSAEAGVIRSHNVLGMLPGSTRPNETVVYSAHWDHLGIGAPDTRGDGTYNGAVDNASGTAALLELSRAFGAAPRTRRTVVFLAVTAEEKGLLGSEFYAQNPVYPLATTAGVFNLDTPFGWGAARDFTISGQAKLGLLDMLIAQGTKQGLRYTPDPHPEAGHFYRSDHFSLAKLGVPAVTVSAGQDLVTGGTAEGQKRYDAYMRSQYHQPADEWSPQLVLTGAPPTLALLYATGRTLADGASWPNWSRDSEFRLIRDKTAAQRR